MYDNLQGVGGFELGSYWSSNEFGAENALYMHFGYGTLNDTDKGDDVSVRPVRAF
jgi:hypothetical protein